jgi:tetratricopeptide (TPR) repeat protein
LAFFLVAHALIQGASASAAPGPASDPGKAERASGAKTSTPKARPTRTPPSARGPRSEAEEAPFLLRAGTEAFRAGDHARAARDLRRLIERYPSTPGALDARLLLGRAELERGQPAAAQGPLRDFIAAAGKSAAGLEARLDLGRALLALKRFNEAYLTSIELTGRESLPWDVEVPALLLRGEALLGLEQDERALQAQASAEKVFLAQGRPSEAGVSTRIEQGAASNAASEREWLRQRLLSLRLRLVLRSCAKLPGAGLLTEEQALDQLRRRGECLVEAALIVRSALLPEKGSVSARGVAQEERVVLSELERSLEALRRSFGDYQAACLSPPQRPGKRTAAELRRYRSELSARVLRDHDATVGRVLLVLDPPRSGASNEQAPLASPSGLTYPAAPLGAEESQDPLSLPRRRRLDLLRRELASLMQRN